MSGEGAERVLIVGLSGRSLAQSARRAGFGPVVLDAFADLDTREAASACERVPVGAGWLLETGPLLDAAHRLAPPPVPLAYASGFERQPDLLEALARDRELLGCEPETVATAKDPFAFAALLAGLGIPHPEVHRDPPADLAGWLTKRAGGAGGGHVRWAAAEVEGEPARYYQRHVPGRSVGALVVGNGERAVCLGLSDQWHDPAPGRPFRYGGAAVPGEEVPGLAAASARVAAASGLRGLGSVDALADEDGFHVLELNPRPGAALDAFERAFGRSLFAVHVAACRGALPEGWPAAPERAAASMLLRAPRDLAIPPGLRWPPWTADRGEPGTAVPEGGPVCTLMGEGLTAAEAREVAETRAITLTSRLLRHGARAAG